MTNLTIRHAAPDDWPILAEMGARIFLSGSADGDHYQAELQSWLQFPHDPTFNIENSWLGFVDGQIVAHVAFIERTLRYGCAELTFGGIAAVMTRPEFRRRGYADQLMRVVIDQITQRGHPISLLDGISRFYDRFGFTTLWHGYTTHFAVKEALRVPPDDSAYRVRSFQPDDVPALLALYDREWGNRPWSVKRTPDWLHHRLRLPMHETLVVEDAAGTVRGYSSGRVLQDRIEVLVDDQGAAAAFLRHTGQQLAGTPDQIVQWLDPPDTRTARFVRRLCSMHHRTWVSHRGGWMGRFIRTQAALNALRPEFVARLHALGLPGAEEAEFDTGPDSVTVRVGALSMDVPQPMFLQLVFGFLAPADIDDYLSVTVGESERDLLKRLFPPTINGLAGLDWF
jgi:predicted N-acetyltransferase YhbS